MKLLGFPEMKRLIGNRRSRNNTVFHEEHVPSNLNETDIRQQAHTLLRLRRKLLVSPWKRHAIKIARAETRHLMSLIRLSGITTDEISSSAPALGRCLAKRQVIYTNILGTISMVGAVILYIVMFMPTWPYTQNMLFMTVESQTVFPVLSVVGLLILNKYDDDFKRLRTFATRMQRFGIKYILLMLPMLSMLSVLLNYEMIYVMISRLTVYQFVVVSAQSVLMLSYMILAYWLARIVLRWRAPDLMLVRALADAFEIVLTASPANWRSISLRSKAARYIHKAAMALEGPIARKFAASAGFSDAEAIQNRFQMAGAALRSKVAWLATPRADTKSFLARALALELLIAATGDLDRLEYSEIRQTQATVSWIARLRSTAGWAIFGLGPAIFVVVGRTVGWISDPASTAILVQFAFLCFFVAVLSAADPSGYKERLTSVTGTGATLFGWKKSETKD